MMKLKTVIGQCAVEAGHLNVNFNQMKEMIEQAERADADLIVFPELALSGTCVGDKWEAKEFIDDLCSYNQKLAAMSTDLMIVWSNVLKEEGRLYNAVYCAVNGQIVYTQTKRVLKSTNTSSEHRFFSVKENASTVEYKGVQLGFVMADEIHHSDLIPSCDILIHIESKPWTLDDEGLYDVMMKQLNHPCVVHVNAAGMQNTGKNVLMFDGGSAVYQMGEATCRLTDGFVSECAVIEGAFDHRIEHKLMNCLVHSIREFDRQTLPYKPKWIIGLSGGLDSSVTAALLSMAVGADRVVGYNLATRYNSENTKDNASNLANALGIELRNGYISEVVEASVRTAEIYGYKEENMATLVHENIQARVRGHMLSTFAQIENGVIMNNGNKIEVALGYATMYGDSIGAIGPIGDLTKVQLFDLSHEINAYLGLEVIPERLLPVVNDESLTWEMAPSAELREAQYDPMKWFYHDWLIDQLTGDTTAEDVMEDYLSGKLMHSSMGRWLKYYHLDNGKNFIEDLEWVLRQMRVSIFKRVQSVPVVMVSKRAYGTNTQEVQGIFDVSERYAKLKEAILRG